MPDLTAARRDLRPFTECLLFFETTLALSRRVAELTKTLKANQESA
jgi:hypothetical protein